MRRRALLIVPALLGAALVAPAHAEAARAGASHVSAGHAQTVHPDAARKAKKKRKKAPKVLHLPAKPVIHGAALPYRLFHIANGLRIPVFIAATVALGVLLFDLGAFFVELARRHRGGGRVAEVQTASANAHSRGKAA